MFVTIETCNYSREPGPWVYVVPEIAETTTATTADGAEVTGPWVWVCKKADLEAACGVDTVPLDDGEKYLIDENDYTWTFAFQSPSKRYLAGKMSPAPDLGPKVRTFVYTGDDDEDDNT